MWYEIPTATAGLIAIALNALADQYRAAFDHLCSTLPFNVALEMMEQTRADCEQLAQTLERERALAEQSRRQSIQQYLPEASVRLVVDGLGIVPCYTEPQHGIVQVAESLRASISRQVILLPDVAVPLDDRQDEPAVRPS